MNIQEELKNINTALDDYRAQLETIPDAQFDVTPPTGGWSYAEVYSHIMQATIGASMMLERCTNNTAKPGKGGLNFWGFYILSIGKFPPIKVKVPLKVADKLTPQKISKDDAVNLVVKCRKRMEEMAELIKKKPSDRRAQHPRMGRLSAGQWFKFIRIHLQHHLKQLARIKKSLN